MLADLIKSQFLLGGFLLSLPSLLLSAAEPTYSQEAISTDTASFFTSKDTVLSICAGSCIDWNGQLLCTPGTYYDSERGVTLHLSVLPEASMQLLTPDTAITKGKSIRLYATGADMYMWYPQTGLSDAASSSPTVTPAATTTYYVKGYDLMNDNLVSNGDFELGVAGKSSFTTQLQYSTKDGLYGKYSIGTDSYSMWRGSGHHGDHTSGDGMYMLVDGFDQPNKVLWEQTVSVQPYTDYVFTAWFISLYTSMQYSSFAKLQFFVNDVQLGDVVESPHDGNTWGQYYEQWNSGNCTTAKLTIKNQNTNGAGNDLGIDDISFTALSPCYAIDSVTVTVEPFYDYAVDISRDGTCLIQQRPTADKAKEKIKFNADGYAALTGKYKKNDVIRLTAYGDGCYTFSHWNDGDTHNPRYVTVTRSGTTYTAFFRPYKLQITAISDDDSSGIVSLF